MPANTGPTRVGDLVGRKQAQLGLLPHWTDRPVAVLDFETTSPDPMTCRMVSVSLALVAKDGSVVGDSVYQLVNCGVPIPAGATEVHGITEDMVRGPMGRSPDEVVGELIEKVDKLAEKHWPLVMFNAAFDWTLLCLEAERCGIKGPSWPPLVDPRLIDRIYDKYRAGGRTQEALAQYYRVEVPGTLHNARSDCIATAQILRAQVRRFDAVWCQEERVNERPLRDFEPSELHEMQEKVWWPRFKRELNEYMERKGLDKRVTGGWPIVTEEDHDAGSGDQGQAAGGGG